MPFIMTHLLIAQQIIDSTPEIRDPGAFLLGSIAPDSICKRQHYRREMKSATHLRPQGSTWGDINVYEEWIGDVFRVLEKTRGEHSDYVAGCFAHILTDIRHDNWFWPPNKNRSQDELELFIRDFVAIDYALHHRESDNSLLFPLLREASGVTAEPFSDACEAEKFKSYVLEEMHSGSAPQDTAHNRFVTMRDTEDFIRRESKWVRDRLFAHCPSNNG